MQLKYKYQKDCLDRWFEGSKVTDIGNRVTFLLRHPGLESKKAREGTTNPECVLGGRRTIENFMAGRSELNSSKWEPLLKVLKYPRAKWPEMRSEMGDAQRADREGQLRPAQVSSEFQEICEAIEEMLEDGLIDLEVEFGQVSKSGGTMLATVKSFPKRRPVKDRYLVEIGIKEIEIVVRSGTSKLVEGGLEREEQPTSNLYYQKISPGREYKIIVKKKPDDNLFFIGPVLRCRESSLFEIEAEEGAADDVIEVNYILPPQEVVPGGIKGVIDSNSTDFANLVGQEAIKEMVSKEIESESKKYQLVFNGGTRDE